MTQRDDMLNALFRAEVERQYGAPMMDEVFRRGKGQYAHEPYTTAMATRFRDFVAGYEAALPEGWVAVPREPTEAMMDAVDCQSKCVDQPDGRGRYWLAQSRAERYANMLAAAPQAHPATGTDEPADVVR